METLPAIRNLRCTENMKRTISGSFKNVYTQEGQTLNPETELDVMLNEINEIISTIVGLEAVKDQLQKWMKGLLISQRRKSLGIKVGAQNIPHMAFLGNPGTGKTMVARILGKLLHRLGVASTNKVVEVQRTDLVGEYIGQTGLKTRQKIKEACGGIMFIDEAYRLMPQNSGRDFGREALEEIMSAMDKGDVITIFAGYTEEMNHVFTANAGFARRVTKVFYFEDYTPKDIAVIMLLKFKAQEEGSFLDGLKLDQKCTANAIAAMISKRIPEEHLRRMNGGLVHPWLVNALENMNFRLNLKCSDVYVLTTIMKKDLDEGLKSLQKSMAIETNESSKSSPATASLKKNPARPLHVEMIVDAAGEKSPAKKEASVKKARVKKAEENVGRAKKAAGTRL